MSGWCADLFRSIWSLIYWNARKTLFRLRGARGTAPCQNPSDSGLAHETGCDACLQWRQPRRFRHVCPLLSASPGYAPLCTVNASAVRPFWGRAGLFLGAGAVGLYLLLTLLAFGFLKQRGYEVSLHHIVLPTQWKHFPEIQARLFFNKGSEAYAAGRLNEAVLALSFAYERAPQNYEAGALLAWIWQASQPTLSNRVYFQLLREHPDRRSETSQRWYRILLNRGDFESVGQLAIEQLATPTTHADAPWTYALLFASRQAPSARLIAKALERKDLLSPEVQAILQWEEKLTAADPQAAEAALLEASRNTPASPFALHHRVDSLIRLGRPREALRLLTIHGASLDERTFATLKLAALGADGNTPHRRVEIETLLQTGPTLAVVEFVTANLIQYPDPSLVHDYLSALERHPLPLVPEHFAAYAGLFCLAALSFDTEHSRHFAETLRHIAGSPLSFLEHVERFLHGETEDRRLSSYLSRLQPLPLEVVFALYDRGDADGWQARTSRP